MEGREPIKLIVITAGMERQSNRMAEQEIMITLFIVNHFSNFAKFVMMISRFSDLATKGL